MRRGRLPRSERLFFDSPAFFSENTNPLGKKTGLAVMKKQDAFRTSRQAADNDQAGQRQVFYQGGFSKRKPGMKKLRL